MDYQRASMTAGMLIGASIVAIALGRRVHWSVAAAFLWAAASGILATQTPTSRYEPFGAFGMTAMEGVVSASLAYLMLFAGMALSLTLRARACVLWFLCSTAVPSSLLIFWHAGKGELATGILGSSSLDAFYLAVLFPVIVWAPGAFRYRLSRHLTATVALVAIFATRSSTGIGGVVLGITVYLIANRAKRIADVLSPLALAIAIMGLASYAIPELFSTSGRSAFWPVVWRYFQDNVDQVQGAGLGSFFLYGPMIAKGHGSGRELWTWLHNDWGQVLFELGWPGLASVALVFLSALYRARGRAWLLSSLIVYGAVAAMQMPLRLFPSALLGLLLLLEAFGGEPRGT